MIFLGKRNAGGGKGIGKRRKHEEELICHEEYKFDDTPLGYQ